jgi:cation transport ATPase
MMFIAVVGAVVLGDYTEAGFIVFLFTTADWLETLARYKVSFSLLLLAFCELKNHKARELDPVSTFDRFMLIQIDN